MLGAAIAIVTGVFGGYFVGFQEVILLALIFLGLIVGLLNIRDKEITKFLIATIALLLVGSANLIEVNNVVSGLGTILQVIVMNISTFVMPAALVVALKSVYNLARAP